MRLTGRRVRPTVRWSIRVEGSGAPADRHEVQFVSLRARAVCLQCESRLPPRTEAWWDEEARVALCSEPLSGFAGFLAMLLAKARKETGLAVITELLSENHAEMVAEYADILQIGARNAQNFQLLIAAAKTGKPVLLKRGLSMKIEEWLLAGEYVLANENPNLMFCERGIRTFETYTRNTLDLSTIPIIKHESHCPIVIDPSQGAGRADLVATMCKGAVAMGADALLIEVHPNPAEAWSDGSQQVTLDGFAKLMKELKPFIAAAGRE